MSGRFNVSNSNRLSAGAYKVEHTGVQQEHTGNSIQLLRREQEHAGLSIQHTVSAIAEGEGGQVLRREELVTGKLRYSVWSNGVQVLDWSAMGVDAYHSLGPEAKQFLMELPITWDQVELISGTPGSSP